MLHESSWRRLALAALIFGVGASLLGQLAQPFHILTHEFTQGFTALCLLVLPLGAAWLYRRVDDGPGPALAGALAAAGMAGIGAFAAHLVANAAVYQCVVEDAIAFFWITWTPIAAFACVLGVVAADREWSTRRLLALVVALFLLSGAHDGLQFLSGVRIVDPVLGDPLGFNQRGDMQVPLLHVWQRLWVLTAALALWLGSRWQQDLLRAVLGVGALLFLTLGAGSHVGVGWGKSRLHAVLDAERTSEHFVFRYPSKGRASVYMDQVVRDAEWHFHTLTEDWRVQPTHKVRVRVYDSTEQLAEATGISAPHAGLYQVDIPIQRTWTDTFPHELVHALHTELAFNPRLVWTRGMAEGTAVAFSEHYVAVVEAHRTLAGALKSDTLPAATAFMSLDGFSSVNEGNAYDAAGSFLGFLVLQYGLEKFTALQRAFDYQGVYGRDLAGLDAEWRAFLQEVPVDLEEMARARDDYDPAIKPSYLQKRCPKLGARREMLTDKAKRRWKNEDYEGAQKLYAKLLEQKGQARWAVWSAAALHALDRPDEALALLDRQLGRDDLGEDERFRLLQWRISILIGVGDFDALYAAYDERNAVDDQPSMYRSQVEAALRDPEIRAPVARFLDLGHAVVGRRFLMDLQLAHPETPALDYLVAARGGLLPSGRGGGLVLAREDRLRIDEALEALERAPGACDHLSDTLVDLADQVIRIGDFALAARLATAVQTSCDDPVAQYRADRRLARIVWERAR